MKFCKGTECKKYGAIYHDIYIPDINTGRLCRKTVCEKRSCYHEPLGCYRGYIDMIIYIIIFKFRRSSCKKS